MQRIGSGLDTINFGTASGGGVSSYNDLTDIPADVQALGAGGQVSSLNVATLSADAATIVNSLESQGLQVLSSQGSTQEGAPGSTNDKALPNSCSVWQIQTDNGNNTYTGLAAPANEREITIVNKGPTGTLTLSHQSASSAAANRIICPSSTDKVLAVGQGCRLRYDVGATRWRIITG